MQAIIKSVSHERSRNPELGMIYRITFETRDGKRFKTYTGKYYHNFPKWKKVLELENNGVGTLIDGLMIKNDDVVNADSKFYIARMPDIQMNLFGGKAVA